MQEVKPGSIIVAYGRSDYDAAVPFATVLLVKRIWRDSDGDEQWTVTETSDDYDIIGYDPKRKWLVSSSGYDQTAEIVKVVDPKPDITIDGDSFDFGNLSSDNSDVIWCVNGVYMCSPTESEIRAALKGSCSITIPLPQQHRAELIKCLAPYNLDVAFVDGNTIVTGNKHEINCWLAATNIPDYLTEES
jgi:hypothetical protein